MDIRRLEAEVDANYEAFVASLAILLPQHPGEYVLIRAGEMKGFYGDAGSALAAGRRAYTDGIYSIQEVTDRPVDLGFFSHAVDSRIA